MMVYIAKIGLFALKINVLNNFMFLNYFNRMYDNDLSQLQVFIRRFVDFKLCILHFFKKKTKIKKIFPKM